MHITSYLLHPSTDNDGLKTCRISCIKIESVFNGDNDADHKDLRGHNNLSDTTDLSARRRKFVTVEIYDPQSFHSYPVVNRNYNVEAKYILKFRKVSARASMCCTSSPTPAVVIATAYASPGKWQLLRFSNKWLMLGAAEPREPDGGKYSKKISRSRFARWIFFVRVSRCRIHSIHSCPQS